MFSPSAYTGEAALMNYKSLECYQRFIAGWVREILVSVQGETRVLTSKVCYCHLFLVTTYMHCMMHGAQVSYPATVINYITLGQPLTEDEGEASTAVGYM